MASVSSDRDRVRLEKELHGSEYGELLRDLQKNEPFLRQFTTWADVLIFMRRGSAEDGRKDEVLRPILQAHSDDHNPRWRGILLAIFWPKLEAIRFRRRRWDADHDDLWQNLAWAFLRVACRADGRQRTDNLARKILNDTTRFLGDRYRSIWRHVEAEIPARRDELEAVADLKGVDVVGIARRAEQAAEHERLQRHFVTGRLTEGDFLLLLGTRVYGKRLCDYARATGLGYQAAKKRRQRAEAAISRAEREMRDSRNDMSPEVGSAPPLCSRKECSD